MTTSTRTQQKSAQPSDLENKGLQPGEDKGLSGDTSSDEAKDAAPAKTDGVDLVIAHGVRAGIVGNKKALYPGDSFTTDKDTAREMIVQGVARRA